MPLPNLIRVFLLFSTAVASVPLACERFVNGAEPARAAAIPGEIRDRVLVMRDGGVLAGRISQSDDRYVVVRGKSEISVPAANVAMLCNSLDEAYKRQRSEMQNPSAESHLHLANWCLVTGLYTRAAEELAAVRRLDPRQPKLELLERRLAVISQPTTTEATPAATPSTNTHVGAERNLTPRPMSMADLPDGVVERFTRKVQPLLVNNCTISGCHRAGGSQTFELDRSLLHGMANRRSTMRNLAAVLELVDRERPQESPLLTIPRLDHGGMDHPIFGPRHSVQFQQLVDWVAMVVPPPAVEGDSAPNGELPTAQFAPERPTTPPRWREPVEPVSFDDEVLPPFQPSVLQYGGRLRGWTPRDPFDPEIFNRQTRAKASTTR